MNKHIIYFILLFLIEGLFTPIWSQVQLNRLMYFKNRDPHLTITGIDSITSFLKEYKVPMYLKEDITKRYEGSSFAWIDSTQILHRIYKEEKKKGEYSLAHGYYNIRKGLMYPDRDPRCIIGVKLNTLCMFNYNNDSYPRNVYREIIACFKAGTPAHEWEYLCRAEKDSIYKKENYKAGLLQGDYIIYNKQDTLYRTVFEHGSGYYKDFFPNGSLWMEGQVKEGYPNGKWQFYHYRHNGEWYKTIVEEYEERKLISSKEFYSKEETERMAEQEKLIQKNKKKWWQFWK